MKILVSNDDGYRAKGLHVLASLMAREGEVTVVAPKYPQSGTGMAVNLGGNALAHKRVDGSELYEGVTPDPSWRQDIRWEYLDGTPASCIKYALNMVYTDVRPDVVLSGINHGTNATTASCYSGTLGATSEAVLYGIPAIGVSLDTWSQDPDFSVIERWFPGIFHFLMRNLPARRGIYYNINFPNLPAERIKGIKTCVMGQGHWVKEYCRATPEGAPLLGDLPHLPNEKGEDLWLMTGEFEDDPDTPALSDHLMMREGWITVVPLQLDNTDLEETRRLNGCGMDRNTPFE